MPHPSAHAMSILLDILRQAWWSMVAGFAVLGATFYGGAAVSSAWRRAAIATPSGPAGVDVESEAARGIAEIESFLADACPDPGNHRAGETESSDQQRRHRRS